MAVLIPVSKGKYHALVDEEDYEYLTQWNWRYIDGYACRSIYATNDDEKRVRRTIRMHRVISEPNDEQQVDHINGDKLDNRRLNLRNVSAKQNQMNKKTSKHSTSKYNEVALQAHGEFARLNVI